MFADCKRREELLRDAARALSVAEMTGTPPVVFASRGEAATLAGYSSSVMTSLEIYRNDSPQPAMSWVGGGLLTSVNKVDGLTYVWIPPGKFRMGCSDGDSECYSGEKPADEVELTRGFFLSETEVTQAAWKRVMGTSPSGFKGDDLPVEQVS